MNWGKSAGKCPNFRLWDTASATSVWGRIHIPYIPVSWHACCSWVLPGSVVEGKGKSLQFISNGMSGAEPFPLESPGQLVLHSFSLRLFYSYLQLWVYASSCDVENVFVIAKRICCLRNTMMLVTCWTWRLPRIVALPKEFFLRCNGRLCKYASDHVVCFCLLFWDRVSFPPHSPPPSVWLAVVELAV